MVVAFMDEEEITVRIVSGSFMLTVGSIIADIVGLLFSIIIARLLGPEGYGIWSLSLVYPSMVAGLVDLGLATIFARYATLSNRDRNIYIWTGIIFRCLLGFIGALTVYFLADAFAHLLARQYMGDYIRILSVYTASYVLLTALGSIFNGLGRYRISASINISQFILRGVLSILFILMGFGVYGAVVACSLAYTILSIIYFIIYTKHVKPIGFSRKALADMLRLSIPLYIASIGGIAVGPFVSTVLARYVSDYDLGNYRVALNALSPIVALQGAISVATLTSLPLLLNNSNSLKKRTEEAILYSSTIFIALVLCYISVISPTIHLFYGRAYAEAPIYATLYSIGIVVSAILGSLVVGSYFITIGVTKWNTITAAIGQLTTIILALTLTSRYSVYGAVISQAIGSIISSIAGLYIAKKLFNLEVNLKPEIKALLPSGLAYIATYTILRLLTNIGVSFVAKIISIIIGLTVYSSVYLAFLPLFVDKGIIRNIIMLVGKVEFVGRILKPLGEAYLRLINIE